MFFIALVLITNPGPGLWVLSQALLLLYFKMDNGSNVCGIEFNYDNKAGKKGEENDEGNKKEEEKDDSKSIIGGDQSDIEAHFNNQLLSKLILSKFEVKSEEGRSVHLC